MSWYAPGAGGGILVTPPITGTGGTNPGTPSVSPGVEDIPELASSVKDAVYNHLVYQGAGDLTSLIGSSFDSDTSAQSSSSNSDALSKYLDIYNSTHDSSWLEKYLDNLIARENTESARAYETQMANTQFSRMLADIRSAGYNPWLALQSGVGQSSVPSSSAAGYSSMNVSSKNKEISQREAEAGKDLLGRGISAVALIMMAILRAVL